MEKIKTICILFVLGAFFCFLPSIAGTAVINVNCPGQTIQAAIIAAHPGDTISVTGTCNENIATGYTVSLTLDGNTTAVIHGPDPNNPTVAVKA